MTGFMRSLAAFKRDTSGHAAVEFAFIIPIVFLLIVAVYDLGLGFTEKIKVQSALNSGMQHVMQTQGADIATTKKVIAHLLGDSASQANVSVTSLCKCGSTTTACTNSCSAGLKTYVKASASRPYASALMGVDMSIAANFELLVGYK